MRFDLPRVLLGVAGVLALLLVLQWVWPYGEAAGLTVSPARVAVRARAPALAARDTSAWVSAILARPLFSVTRRPPRVAAKVAGAVAPGQARLAGIMITRYGRRAIFAPEGGGKPMVLAEGATVNESTIRRILPDQVVMANGAALRPSYDRNRPNTPAFNAFTPGFQPPGFQNPNFQNPNFQQPNFLNPVSPGGFPNPNFPPGQGVAPPTPGEETGQPNPPPPLLMRGGIVPQRRE